MSTRNIRQVVNYNAAPGVSYPALITSLAEDGTANGLAVFHEGGVEVMQVVPRGGPCGNNPGPGTWTWAETWSETAPAPAPMRSTRASTDKEPFFHNELETQQRAASIAREASASRVDSLQRQLVKARAHAAMLRERLAAVEWGNTEVDDGGMESYYCPECGGARHKKDHRSGCLLKQALDQTGPGPTASTPRLEVNASGVVTPQSLDGLQGLVEKTMAEQGPEARMCLKAGDLLGLLTTRFGQE